MTARYPRHSDDAVTMPDARSPDCVIVELTSTRWVPQCRACSYMGRAQPTKARAANALRTHIQSRRHRFGRRGKVVR